VLREDGKLIPVTLFESQSESSASQDQNAAAKSKAYVRRHWRYEEPEFQAADSIERIKSHALCISGMAFQDAWNIDMERLRRCCIHVATPAGKLVPFCAYYLTGASGCRIPELQA
jgi:7,8-dihydro-6-hydroxymethylpterin dimethyltransferase